MKKKLLLAAGAVLAASLLLLLLPVFVCDQFRIGGESMSPTLETGDHILVNKLLILSLIHI